MDDDTTVSIGFDGNQYELPNSMSHFNEYQDSSMKTFNRSGPDILTLSHLKIVDISTDENPYLRYKLFVGIMPTIRRRGTRIIIFGEYFINRPYRYNSFNYIEVPESEIIDLYNPILDIGNNLCAILLKKELIVIGITPDFQEYLEPEEVDDWDESEYGKPYLSVTRFNFIYDITDFPFDRSSIDGHPLIDGHPSFEEDMTSSFENDDDGGCKINLYFTKVCRVRFRSSIEIHSKTENQITIYISNKEIRIEYIRDTTTYDRYIVDGEYNDFPRIRTDEESDYFSREITYPRFLKEESEEDD